MAVFVLDTQGQALMPCTEKRARLLLARGRARVHRLVPMVIRLVDRQVASCDLQPLRLKLDPGSKTTGLALVRDAQIIDPQTGEMQTAAVVLNLMELVHRGKQISEALTARRQMRRRRRSNLRHRAPRFLNRGNQKSGWLAPSLQHRVDTCMAWVRRIQRWARSLLASKMPAGRPITMQKNSEVSTRASVTMASDQMPSRPTSSSDTAEPMASLRPANCQASRAISSTSAGMGMVCSTSVTPLSVASMGVRTAWKKGRK